MEQLCGNDRPHGRSVKEPTTLVLPNRVAALFLRDGGRVVVAWTEPQPRDTIPLFPIYLSSTLRFHVSQNHSSWKPTCGVSDRWMLLSIANSISSTL